MHGACNFLRILIHYSNNNARWNIYMNTVLHYYKTKICNIPQIFPLWSIFFAVLTNVDHILVNDFIWCNSVSLADRG